MSKFYMYLYDFFKAISDYFWLKSVKHNKSIKK